MTKNEGSEEEAIDRFLAAMTPNEALAKYKEARTKYEEADRVAKELEKERRAAESELIDTFLDNGITSMACDDGSSVSLARRESISVNASNEQDVLMFLQEKHGDTQQFVTPKLNKKLVERYIKESIEEGQIQEFEIPSSMNYNTRPTVRLSGATKL